MELTKGAAENYHLSWWRRHGVVLDGEIAAVCHKHGKYDLAANSYEKVCALYAGEGWQDLLAEVLPNLAECQKMLNDEASYLQSCVRLLSLDKSLFSTKERRAFQAEVICLAHSEMKHPVPLDVSSLITFSGNPGRPLQLCDGDPGTLSVTVWSGFPDDITLESLSLTLMETHNADEGAKVCLSTSVCSIIIFPLLNRNITLALSSCLKINATLAIWVFFKINVTYFGIWVFSISLLTQKAKLPSFFHLCPILFFISTPKPNVSLFLKRKEPGSNNLVNDSLSF